MLVRLPNLGTLGWLVEVAVFASSTEAAAHTYDLSHCLVRGAADSLVKCAVSLGLGLINLRRDLSATGLEMQYAARPKFQVALN